MDFQGSRTQANLMAAFAGESQARNKYTFYAAKAHEEGYEQIADIFRETAQNEKEHAELWLKALHGGDLPTTTRNLEDAAGGKPFKRVTYNEITKGAVLKAVAAPRDIDIPMVDAQQARRILDRIVGYMVSPVLWRNVRVSNAKTLSAGRVQSVALRLLVERQREIDSFKPETYYLMGAIAKKRGAGKDGEFKAKQSIPTAFRICSAKQGMAPNSSCGLTTGLRASSTTWRFP